MNKLRLLNIFGDLLVIIQISRLSVFSNKKLGLQFYDQGDALQVTILPTSILEVEKPFTGEGTLTEMQSKACGHRCGFKVSGLPNSLKGESCYVNNEARTAANAAKKIYDNVSKYYDQDTYNPTVNPINYMLRLSVWGDLGRLNAEGQAAMLALAQGAREVRGYCSDFDQLINIEAWRDLIQASCQTRQDVDKARLLGFKQYLGTDEAYQYARSLDKVLRCPWTKKNRARALSENQATLRFGCVKCALSCDGKYNIDGRHI
jgi:hypothetical protein